MRAEISERQRSCGSYFGLFVGDGLFGELLSACIARQLR